MQKSIFIVTSFSDFHSGAENRCSIPEYLKYLGTYTGGPRRGAGNTETKDLLQRYLRHLLCSTNQEAHMLVSEIGAVYGSRKLLMHMCALSTIPVRRFAWSKYSVVRRKAAGKAEALKRRYVIVFRFGSSYGFDCPSCLKEKNLHRLVRGLWSHPPVGWVHGLRL